MQFIPSLRFRRERVTLLANERGPYYLQVSACARLRFLAIEVTLVVEDCNVHVLVRRGAVNFQAVPFTRNKVVIRLSVEEIQVAIICMILKAGSLVAEKSGHPVCLIVIDVNVLEAASNCYLPYFLNVALVDFPNFIGFSHLNCIQETAKVTRNNTVLVVAHANVVVAFQERIVRVCL